MNDVFCKYHENKKALFIVWNSYSLMFICEECISSNQIDQSTKSNQWKKLVIEKAIREPDYFFSQFQLNDLNRIRIYTLQKHSLEKLKHLIEQAEKYIQEIQCILDRIINDLKLEFLNIKENKENHRQQLEQVQQYQNFRKIIDEIFNCQIKLNQEIIMKYEINLKQLCHSIENNPISLNQELERVLLNCNYNSKQSYQHQNQLKEQIQRIQLLIQPFRNQYNTISFISEEYLDELFGRISLNSKKSIAKADLIFNGRNNVLNGTNFWKKVQNKENLLMIFKSNNNYIFGAYSPCKWIYTKNKSFADKTKTSFIFSKNNFSFHPIVEKDYKAIHCDQTKGPCFGYCESEGQIEYDLSIEDDFQKGCSYLGNNYEWKNMESQKLNCYLFGQVQPKIVDCEIYEIKFK